jgi:GntR family transcriptional regulator/MocR family aminotransferase
VTLHISLVGRRDLSGEIYRQVRDAIINGVLHLGDRLPASRELARTLSVSRMTVTVAYDRLTSEGFAVARLGDGTFVSQHAVRSRGDTRGREVEGRLQPRRLWQSIPLPTAFAHPAIFDFRSGIPDAALFPHRTWRRLVARTLRAEGSATGHYADPAGDPNLRRAIARHLGISRGIAVSADDVTITNGTQQALDVLARVLLAPGDRVVVEDPGYWPPRRLFESLGARVLAVPVDAEGLRVKALPRHVRVVYVTPSHQYPLGMSMTLPRRQALLTWADRNDAAIIEDDYDTEFRFGGRPLEPLRMLDTTGRVIYVGSFSKTLLPSLRLGFLVAPRSLCPAVHKAKFLSDWHSPTLTQGALARFIDDGGFGRHIRRMNAIYGERREMLTDILARDFADHLEMVPSTTGLHIAAAARTASVDRIAAIARRAANADVAVQTLSSFAVGGQPRAGLVLGFGGIGEKQIEEGLRRLRRCFNA